MQKGSKDVGTPLARRRPLPLAPVGPPEALCGGISKVNFQETLSSFGDKCPQNGSKTAPRAPKPPLECPHEGSSVGPISSSSTPPAARARDARATEGP